MTKSPAKRKKAIAVAKEILLLSKGAFKLSRGLGYLRTDGPLPLEPKKFQAALKDPRKLRECEVCAVGAAVVAYSRLFNKIRPANFHRADGKTDLDYRGCAMALLPAFEGAELEAMEFAFEEEGSSLQKIARNIIKNNGVFVEN